MKNLTSLICAGLLIAFATVASAAKVQHVVSFKFKSTASPAEVQKIESAFKGLKGKIKEIKALEWGTNVSPEKLNKGFTHCWILTFNSEKDRDTYLEHPDHKEFAKLVGGVLEDVFVIDFVVQK